MNRQRAGRPARPGRTTEGAHRMGTKTTLTAIPPIDEADGVMDEVQA